MEEMRIAALILFLCGLWFGFVFGMLCCLDEDEKEWFPPLPAPPVARHCEPTAPLKTRVAHDLAKVVRAKLKAQKERKNNANPRSNT
ncbi:hypothetical protein [Yersinia alsatica]|uniref:hypothetical protein n=1 Tax=Yersinia alsatica TaxID=2890317 RepID=UPI0011A57EBB|nr:hypothetical protein [Yersinia alsatica]